MVKVYEPLEVSTLLMKCSMTLITMNRLKNSHLNKMIQVYNMAIYCSFLFLINQMGITVGFHKRDLINADHLHVFVFHG